MKKLILTAAIAVMGLGTTMAQEVKLGAKAGVNFAKLTGDDLEDADGRTGFHLGVLAEIPINEKFAIQPELLYSQQGLQTKTQELGVEFETKFILDYINIPVMAKYYLIDGLSVEAGPQLGFNVKAEAEIDVDAENAENAASTDLSDEVETIDLGLGAGVAYQLPQGVFFQARYVFGITNVFDAEDLIGDDLTNSNLSLSVGYKF